MSARRRAMSMVEVLVAVSITVVVMLAVFQALSASFTAFRANQSQAMVTMRARTVMVRLLDHVRATALHQPQDSTLLGTFQNIKPTDSQTYVDDVGIKLAETQSDGVSVIYYTYYLDSTNAANKRLMMKREGTTITTSTNVLLNGVTAFNVRMWPGMSDPRNMTTNDILTKAAITLTAQELNKGLATGYRITGSNATPDSVSVSGSVTPRQSAWSGQDLNYTIDKILAQNH